MHKQKIVRLCAALAALATFGMVLPAAAEEPDSIKEAKEEREDARREQLEARINLELIAAEDIEVVEALTAATDLVNLQQAKIDSATQRLTAAEDAGTQAARELLLAGEDIAALEQQALEYALEAYLGQSDRRAGAWLNASDATVAAHKVALLDSLGTDTFDVLDQLRSIEERRSALAAEAQNAKASADQIATELSAALGDLAQKQAVEQDLKDELERRRDKWEIALETAEAEEAERSAFIRSEEERIERELEAARRARLGASSPVNPNIGVVSNAGWTWPVAGKLVSGFGQRRHPILGYYKMHSGYDLAAPQGTPVWAASDGIVELAGWNGGYGIAAIVGHGDSTTTLYAHMSGVAVSAGEYVSVGQLIGYVGSTGLSTGPHLHFEVRVGGSPVNPAPYLP